MAWESLSGAFFFTFFLFPPLHVLFSPPFFYRCYVNRWLSVSVFPGAEKRFFSSFCTRIVSSPDCDLSSICFVSISGGGLLLLLRDINCRFALCGEGHDVSIPLFSTLLPIVILTLERERRAGEKGGGLSCYGVYISDIWFFFLNWGKRCMQFMCIYMASFLHALFSGLLHLLSFNSIHLAIEPLFEQKHTIDHGN